MNREPALKQEAPTPQMNQQVDYTTERNTMKRYISEEEVHKLITEAIEGMSSTDPNTKQKSDMLKLIDKKLFSIEDDIIVGRTK